MSDMVERVAKALCEHVDSKWDAANFNETAAGDEPEEQREYWRGIARAAIAAMREPSESMLATQGKSRPDKAKTEAARRMAERLNDEMRGIAIEIWTELIDAALSQSHSPNAADTSTGDSP